eukprot:augustus_masked-scaffold_8-processed-gene-8.4-mRNA-1 protein AED:0.00 eAED:0.00 QI:0/-1/0/1/-1/1/1/0/527
MISIARNLRKLKFSTSTALKPFYPNIISNTPIEQTSSTQLIDVLNPATTSVLTTIPNSTQEDVSKAIDSAHEAFESTIWRLNPTLRAQVLSDTAAILSKPEVLSKITMIESLQTGRAIKELNAQLGRVPEWFTYHASLLRTHEGTVPPFAGSAATPDGGFLNFVERVPLGPVAQITPWNHPVLIAVKKLAPALAAGNTIVFKPSELAPASANLIMEVMIEAGLPAGVVNLIHGAGAVSGKALVKDPRMKLVDLTGGTETGKQVGKVVGGNLSRYVAELGGKAPMVIFDDVDVGKAANYAAFGSMIATGQTCIMSSRLIVHENIFDEFVEKLKVKYEKIKLGNPQDESTQMGPVISKPQLERVKKFVELAREEGCEVITGGEEVDLGGDFSKGYFYKPTLIRVQGHERVAQEEVFGPVVVVYSFGGKDDEADAVKKANDSEYGLAASVFCKDGQKALRVARQFNVGIAWVNDHHKNDPSSPWGGMGASGLGRENGKEAFLQYSQTRSVVMNLQKGDFDWFEQKDARYG